MVMGWPGRGVNLMALGLSRLTRTDWGPGVNGLGAGESRVKGTLRELISNPGGADKRHLFEVEISVLSCRLKFWSLQEKVLSIAAPRLIPWPGTKLFGSQTV